MKVCKTCNKPLTEDNCYPSDFKNGLLTCRTCRYENSRKQLDKTMTPIYGITYTLNLRQEVFDNYGHLCSCCGESGWQFLTIDHINNWGAEHRKLIGNRGGTALYRWLKTNSFPKDMFRALCMNCNSCIGHYGFCSHEYEVKSDVCVGCQTPLCGTNTIEFDPNFPLALCNVCLLSKSRKTNSVLEFDSRGKDVLTRRLENKRATIKRRKMLIEGYGGVCECCNESRYMFLTVDHIHNDGAEERKKLGKNLLKFYRQLIKDGFPKDRYRLLCYNCNCCRGAFKTCYHDRINEIDISTISKYLEHMKYKLLDNN